LKSPAQKEEEKSGPHHPSFITYFRGKRKKESTRRGGKSRSETLFFSLDVSAERKKKRKKTFNKQLSEGKTEISHVTLPISPRPAPERKQEKGGGALKRVGRPKRKKKKGSKGELTPALLLLSFTRSNIEQEKKKDLPYWRGGREKEKRPSPHNFLFTVRGKEEVTEEKKKKRGARQRQPLGFSFLSALEREKGRKGAGKR